MISQVAMSVDPSQEYFLRLHIAYPPSISGVQGYNSQVGHVFISLQDPYGEKFVGFNAAFQVLGKENVDSNHHINGLRDAFKPVDSIISDDSRYLKVVTHSTEFSLSFEQFQKVEKEITRWSEEKPPYILALRNCVTFACAIAKKAGIRPPPQLLGIPTPVGTGLGLGLQQNLQKWRENRISNSDIMIPQPIRQYGRSL